MARTQLADRTIVITGASSGIGLATALACAAKGMRVALAARRVPLLEAAQERLAARGVRSIAMACDVTSRDDCERLIQRTEEELGPIYAVFANAGFGEQMPVLPDIDAHQAQFDVNFWGSLRVIAPAVERMQRRGEGHVLLCSSCLSKIGMPYYAAYCATKAAQDHFARAMRHELRPAGIAVSSVHPVGTETEFMERLRERSPKGLLATGGKRRFVQSADRVAQAVLSCLERPRGEVWTSLPARLSLAAAVAVPGLADWAIARSLAGREKRADARDHTGHDLTADE